MRISMLSPRGWLAALLLAGLLPAALRADIVYLKSGGTIEGKVIDAGNSYRVITQNGELTIAKSQVLKIVPSEDPITVFDAKFRAIDAKGPAGPAAAVTAWQDLAGWCRESKLATQEKQCHEAVLGADPENELSRAALGYEKIDGKWLVGDEKMAAKGLVKVKNQWVTPEAKQDLQRTDDLVKAAETNKAAATEAKKAADELETTKQSLADLIARAQVEVAAAKAAQLAALQAQQEAQALRTDAEIARAQALQALLANQEILRQIKEERAKLEALKKAHPAPRPDPMGHGQMPDAPANNSSAGDATHGAPLPPPAPTGK